MRWLVDARPLADAKQGGVSRVARRLVDAVIGLEGGADEIVLATTGSKTPDVVLGARYQVRGTRYAVRHVHLRVPNKLWSAACVADLVSLDAEIEERTGKIDALFLPNLGFVGRVKRPYVLLLHDLSFLIEPKWFSMKMRMWHRAVDAKRTIQNAAHLLSVSETTKRDAMRLLDIPADRITVIPIGPTFSSVIPAQAGIQNPSDGFPTSPRRLLGNDRKKYVLALGAGDPRKNAATAIEAVAALRQEAGFEDVESVLVGQNLPLPLLRKEGNIHILPLHKGELEGVPWIRHAARPSDPELTGLYRNAAAFLYPSWYEGYGLPLHEAAAFGTPCIASTSGALPETAPPGTLFADPAKPHHWVEALRQVLSPVGAPLAGALADIRNRADARPAPTMTEIYAQPWEISGKILLDTLRGVTR
jgi:glycosyltransferase involved in cell wall biosynthesis